MLAPLLLAAFTLAHSAEAARGLAPDAVRAPVTVDAAWIEPGRDGGWIAHMHIVKPRAARLELRGVTSPAFRAVQMWEYGYNDGLETVLPVKTMYFWAPRCIDMTHEGRSYLKLLGPVGRPAIGSRVPLKLDFGPAGTHTFLAPIARSGPLTAPDHAQE